MQDGCRRHALRRVPARGSLPAQSLSSCASSLAAQASSAGNVSVHRRCLCRGPESTSGMCLQGHSVVRGAGHRQGDSRRGRWRGRAPVGRPSWWHSSRARAATASASLAGRPSAPCACCLKWRACSPQQPLTLRCCCVHASCRVSWPVATCSSAAARPCCTSKRV